MNQYIYFFFRFFPHLGHYRYCIEFPVLYSRSLLAIYFICEKLVAQSCLCNLRDYNRPVFLCPWSSSGKNTGVGCHALLQEIFPTQGSNLGLLHCRQILYLLSQQGCLFYIWQCVYVNPNLPIFPFLLSLLVTINLLSTSVTLFLFHK